MKEAQFVAQELHSNFARGFNMNSISIKTALTALFALMIVLIGGMGYLAVTRLGHVNDNVEEFARNWLPSVDTLGQINSNLGDYRYLEGEHIISNSPEEKAAREKELAGVEEEFKKNIAAFQKLADTDAERRSFGDFNGKWSAYLQDHRKLLELSRANNEAEAEKLYVGALGKLYDEMNTLVDEMLTSNRAGAVRSASDAAAEYVETRWETFLIVGAGLVLAIAAMIYSFFGVSRPIEQITGSMTVLAKGDTSKPIPFGDRQNEIGSMAGAVQVFKDNMVRARELEKEAEAAKVRAEADRKREMAQMADQFERAVGGIVNAVSNAATELQSAAQALSSSASETTHQSTIVAAASEQASANVRTVAAAAEELSGSVREISRQVSESANMASKAVHEAEQTTAQVSGLSAGAQKIGAIVDLINDIASKTNLLALNATIEAARAGEAGRGFAVVASEVKALAEQTSKATAEITGHIGAVQSSTDQAANAILGIGKTINDINHIASTIAAAVEEQGAATEEIARNVDQASQGTTEVNRNITGVNSAAETSSASAGQVLSSATELAQQSEKLRTEMQKFLATVRAA
jgi:methyl-accepting chemotaxis protein